MSSSSRAVRALLLLTPLALAPACDAGPGEEAVAPTDPPGAAGGKADSPDPYLVIGRTPTFLKQRLVDGRGAPVMAVDLPDDEKCALEPGQRLALRAAPAYADDHLLVELAEPVADCALLRGYVYRPHVAQQSGATPGGCRAEMGARSCALLGMLAWSEGTGERYDITFGYHSFSSFADHPRRTYCSGGHCSDAAGRYQFLSTTWDGARRTLGLPSFEPAAQDRAALYLIRQRGVDAESIGSFDQFARAISRLGLEWASLPGSPYGQPAHTLSECYREYLRRLGS